MTKRRHLIVLGGFLGAGKTSALVALARWLGDQGLRVAGVTNDQAQGLVDTVLLRACGIAAEEVAGGCFCCRFDDLLGATARLGTALDPDVIIAEAVGSCTDLSATVAAPIRRLADVSFTVAPVTAIVDVDRARQMLGLDSRERWSSDVQYVFRKQLEEAEVIAINKCELLSPAGVDEAAVAIARVAPRAELFRVSVRSGDGLERWFARLLQPGATGADRPAIDVDYAVYAAGEAELGWMNASFTATAARAADGNALLAQVGATLQQRLLEHGVSVAHLKLALHGGGMASSAAAVSQSVTASQAPQLSSRLAGPIDRATMVINLRAQTDPALLEALVRRLGDAAAPHIAPWRLALDEITAFRPSPPVPTHRDRE